MVLPINLSEPVADLASRIRDYVHSQVEGWKGLQELALETDSPQGEKRIRWAHNRGVWIVGDESEQINLETGEIGRLKITTEPYNDKLYHSIPAEWSFVPASDEEVVGMVRHSEFLNARYSESIFRYAEWPILSTSTDWREYQEWKDFSLKLFEARKGYGAFPKKLENPVAWEIWKNILVDYTIERDNSPRDGVFNRREIGLFIDSVYKRIAPQFRIRDNVGSNIFP